MKPLIIEARINEYTQRDPNPHVPFSPEEIGRDAGACRTAGASVVHYHARDPESGAPSADPALYAAAAREIRKHSDVLVMPTLGAGFVDDLDERIGHIEAMAGDPETRADLVPLDLATTNLAMFDVASGRLGGDDLAYRNTVGILKELAARAGAAGAGIMSAIWNVGSLRLLDAMLRAGVLRSPAWCELFLTEGGLIAGHPGTPDGLEAYLRFLPTVEGPLEWAVACYGASAFEVAEIAIERGGHVALGLGDYAYPELPGGAPTNAEVVEEIAGRARAAGRPVATPAEAASLIGLSG